LSQNHRDNYNEVLPVFPYEVVENASSVAGNLDNAIEKATVVVALHPKADWADDCYQLVGQSQFLKQDYESAEHTFEYLIQEYHPDKIVETSNKKQEKVEKQQDRREAEEIKKAEEEDIQRGKGSKSEARSDKKRTSKSRSSKRRTSKRSKSKKRKSTRSSSSNRNKKERSSKKRRSSKDDDKTSRRRSKSDKKRKKGEEDEEEIKPDSYFLKHRPTFQEGKLWLARTYIAKDRHEDALFILSQLEEDPMTFQDVEDDIYAVRAHAYLKRKEYSKAVSPLTKALEVADNRTQKARISFILGQLQQLDGNRTGAYESFEQVKKARPGYVMEFHARLNQVKLSNDVNADPIKDLTRMSKEDKYEEFLGEIHYALASVYRERGDIENMRRQLLAAIRNAGPGSSIKGDAYMQLGDLAFDKSMYVDAKLYYDTTLNIIPATHTRNYDITSRRDRLAPIAEALNVIELQDSLIRISQYTPEQKRLLALAMKKDKEDAANAANKANNPSKFNSGATANAGRFSLPTAGRESNFFAYNDKILTKGKKDFKKSWGLRDLEDNWRRSDKDFDTIIDEEEIERREAADITDDELDKLLSGIPSGEEEITRSHDIRMKAMFDLGKFYRTNLSDYEESMKALENLLKEYPKSPYTAEALYLLYVNAKELGKDALAQTYRQRLAEYSPLSDYLRLIDDPTFADSKALRAQEMIQAYDQAFFAYEDANYSKSRVLLNSLYEDFNLSNALKPKAALLDAHLTGTEKGRAEYSANLEQVVATYPGTDEQKRAQEILRFLRGDKKVFEEGEESSTKFVLEDNRLHYVLLIMKNLDNGVTVNQLRALVSDYNLEYHRLDKLRVGNVFLSRDDTTPILIIRKFTNKDKSLEYYNEVIANTAEFLPDFEYEMMVVNQRNYREILRSKSLEEYRAFFEEHYKPEEKEK